MKKFSVLLVALVFILSSCIAITKIPSTPVETKETVFGDAGEEPVASATEAIETTAAETEPAPEIILPEIITADSYEKKAIDTLGYGGFDFTHKIEYPKILSDKSGAMALNEKIAERYGKYINELKENKEGNILYHVGYTYSVCDNIYFIRITENIGWQYSEGSDSQMIYYFDAENDKELSIAEYLAHFGIDRDKADIGVRHSFELARAGLGTEPYLSEEIGGEKLGAPAVNSLLYRGYDKFDDTVNWDGIEVTENEIKMHMSGTVYITSYFTCVLDRDTCMPVYPNYAGCSMPDGAAESNNIVVTFENGKVTSLSMPSKYEIFAINYSASEITVRSYKNIENCEISINGCEPYSWGNASYDPDTGEFADTFYINEYIPMNEFSSIVITITE